MKVSKLLIHLKSSLWFVPVLCVLAGAALSFGTIALDRYFDYEAIPQSLVGGPDAATEILATVAASMVSLAALVLTITMVVVQLAMGQFSPRIVQRILRDKPSQLAIGLFVATFVHAILALREVTNNGDGTGDVPGIAVVTAFVLVLMSIAVLVVYVHHIGQALRVSALIELVGKETRTLLDHKYPDKGSADVGDGVVKAAKSGVVTGIGVEQLVEEALRAGCKLELVPALGEFVPAGAPLFRVDGDAAGLDEERLRESLVISLEPTLDEDVAYGVRLLVDIAERSLADSPFQDPTTAVQAIDRLHDILRQLARRPFPDGRHRDDAGERQAHRENDELGGVRPPRLRRDPDGRRRVASGLAPAQGRARGLEVDRDARTHADPRRAARPARRRDGGGHGRPARRRSGAAPGPGGDRRGRLSPLTRAVASGA